MSLGAGVGECEHFLVVGVDEIDQLCLICELFGLALVLQFQVLVAQFLQLALLCVNFCFELVLASLVVFDEAVVQLFVFFVDLLYLFFLVVSHFSDLAFQLVDLLLFLLCVLGALLPQPQQLPLAVGLRFFEGFDFSLKLLDHLGVGVLLLSSSCQHFLHYYLVVRQRFVDR